MLLPRVLPEEVPGVSVYTDSARVEDRLQRGEFTGEREERVTYVCSQAGRVQIPAVRIRWWDPETEEWKERELPGVQLEVAGVADSVVAPVMESKADAGMESGGWLRGLLWGFLALLVAGGVGMWWYVRRAYELPPLNPSPSCTRQTALGSPSCTRQTALGSPSCTRQTALGSPSCTRQTALGSPSCTRQTAYCVLGLQQPFRLRVNNAMRPRPLAGAILQQPFRLHPSGNRTYRTQGQDALATNFQTVPVWVGLIGHKGRMPLLPTSSPFRSG
jgi:hypothetical protein